MSKSFCFTLNNYTDEEITIINGLYPTKANYIVYGKEVGENGTPHLQGYIEFSKTIKFNTVKNIIGKRCHLELRKGPQKDAVNYCKKGSQKKTEWNEYKEKGCKFGFNAEFFEIGILSEKHHGKRTDIDIARVHAKIGGMRLVTKKATSLQSIKVAEKYLEYNEDIRNWKPEITWIYGPSGTYKSYTARMLCADKNDTFTKNDGSKWWIGYDGHQFVIIDDFRDSWWGITEMLSLLDRYEKRIETKGGSRQLLARVIIITSIKHPKECYRGCDDEPIAQLLRRIDTIIETSASYIPLGGIPNTVAEVAVEEVGGNTINPDYLKPNENNEITICNKKIDLNYIWKCGHCRNIIDDEFYCDECKRKRIIENCNNTNCSGCYFCLNQNPLDFNTKNNVNYAFLDMKNTFESAFKQS